MQRLAILLIAVIALLTLSPEATAKKKTAPQNWTTTTGVVASGSPASQGVASGQSKPIPNLGCPTADLPSDTEIVVAQGEATTPAGTTAPIWELTTTGNIVVGNHNCFQLTAHVQAYVGVAAPGCVDFQTCVPTLNALPVADVFVIGDCQGSAPVFQSVVPFIQDTGPTLSLTDTAVFFVTVTTKHPQSTGGSLSCVGASFIPLAHNQVQ